MNKELIIQMAHEAGLFVHKEVQPEIERFFQLATEWEREQCAKLLEDTKEWRGKGWVSTLCYHTKKSIATAIRARGETK